MKETQTTSRTAARLRYLLMGGWLMFTLTGALAGGGAVVMSPIVVESAKTATLDDLMTRLESERVVYVGETHTAVADHLLQLEVLRGMARGPGALAIGVEWFQKRFQPVLDEYLAGRIDEAQMLRGSEYYDRWRFDYRLYRPILQFAREQGIPVIALNASRELTGEIRRVGIDDLAEGLRAELPSGYDFSDKGYEDLLREIFKQHQSDDGQFRRFLEVQLTWDESMADGVGAYLEANPDGRILVLAGRGHIVERHGIPNRVTRRTGIKGTTLVTFSPSGNLYNGTDFLVLASEQSLPPAGLMHVLLDERDDGVFIQGFTGGSPAEAAGVKKGDRILSINGEAIEHFADVKIAMIDQRPGNEIELNLQRDGLLGGERTVSLKFHLAGDTVPQHP